MPTKNVVMVSPTSEACVSRSAVTLGKAGVYMWVAKGGTALCRASVRIRPVVMPETRRPVRVGAATSVECHEVELGEVGHLGLPTIADDGHVQGVGVVGPIGRLVGETHGERVGEAALRAHLAQPPELLHAGD